MRRGLVLGALAACSGGSQAGFEPLFDGDSLAGWYTWTPSQGRDLDRHQMFAMEGGELHVLGTDIAPAEFEFGYLATEREYQDFHLRFDYRWGGRHYVNFPKDSGFFFAMVGPDQLWPRSIECQVMVMDTGSVYIFDHATVATTIDPATGRYLEGGTPIRTPRMAEPYPRVTHSSAFDVVDDWNTVEVIARGATAELRVNGNVTFRSTDHLQPDPEAPTDPALDIPLTRGRLVIQQEGAEVWYRNVELMELP